MSKPNKTLSTWRGRLAVGLLAAASACSLTGCYGVGATTSLRKGFLDPTAVGRYQKQPMVVPILSSLDRNVDTTDERFRGATDVTSEDLNPAANDYTIGRNDLISVAITELVAPNVETVKTVRVSESGMISLPLVGQVKAAGLTEAELEREISKAYRQAQIIQNAQVSVSVNEARARTFSILGSVTAPGQYAILNSEFRVLDAFVLARDVNAQGIDYVYVIRQLQQSAPATAPSPSDTLQGPGEDVLTPRSNAGAQSVIRAQAAPATEPEMAEDQKIISVEGRPVAVTPATTPAAEGAAAAPAVTAPTPAPAPALAPATVTEAPAPTVAPATEAPVAQTPAAVAPAAPAETFEFRDPVAAGKTRVIRIPYEALRNGDLRYNIVIKPYDLIVVPQPTVGEYYMGGHVQRVGVYSLTARKITLKQAIVSAGMFDQLAVPAQTDVVRRVGDDREIFVKVDLDKVFEGSQPDIFLRPNDVVQVGTSWWAPFVAAVRGGVRVSYGFGFLYDRNWGDPEDPDFIN